MVAWTAIGIFYYRLHDLILATTGAEDGPERIGRLGNAWLGDMMVMSASVTEVPGTPQGSIDGVPAKPAGAFLVTSHVIFVM